jgi:hypothetical protein
VSIVVKSEVFQFSFSWGEELDSFVLTFNVLDVRNSELG